MAPSIPRIAPGGRASRSVALVLAAVALLSAAVLIPPLAGSRRSPMRQLAGSTPQRSFAPRLSIRTEYHPCTATPHAVGPVPREECGTPGEGPRNLYALTRAGDGIDPDSLQASALAALIWRNGRETALDSLIASLEKALRLSPRRVPLLVDLSAAHLVRAGHTQNSLDLLAGLESAYEALSYEPRNGVARFNAALALEMFGLYAQAVLEWDAFLAVDSTSPWAGEARERRQRLATPALAAIPRPGASGAEVRAFVEQHPQGARELGMDSILSQWGAAWEGGERARADSLLDLADSLGAALVRRRGGDASLADAVLAIRQARSNPRAMSVLARAHRDYARGQSAFTGHRGGAAIEAFTRVIDARPRSAVLVEWAEIFRAAAPEYQGKRPEALKGLRSRLPVVNANRYPALAGRGYFMLSVFYGRDRKADQAQEALGQATLYLARAGEGKSLAKAVSTFAETAYAEGDTVGAYRAIHSAVLGFHTARRSPEAHAVLLALGRFLEQDGMPYAAWAVYNQDIEGVRPQAAIDVVEVHVARARVRRTAGDSAGARYDLAAAYVQTLPDEPRHRQFASGLLRMAHREGLGATQMDSVVEAFADNVVWLLPALMWRADLRLAAGDVEGATRDLQAVTRTVRELTLRQEKAELRAAMMEQARSFFDRLVKVRLDAGRPNDALWALEQGRMSFAPLRRGAVPPGEGRLAAPPGQVAVEYAFIGDTLLTWTISDSIRLWIQPVDRDAFVLAVEQASAALESASAPIPRQTLRRLYDWLILPVRRYLGAPETPLVILADGEVAAVPFAALLHGDRYLVEDHPLRLAATLEDAARPAPRGSGVPLLVANPAFYENDYPMLYRLPGASAEVAALDTIYPQSVRLDGPHATLRAFLDAARRASLVHYAGHAVFIDAHPERSHLVLAGPAATGRLTAEAVDTMRLDGVRLVVLSACRTLRARGGRSGGFAGLSGALLAAGTGGVVGSLWLVDDRLTRPLMETFHQHYRDGMDPARALREAQLRMLRSGNRKEKSPAAWAGFRYTGS